MRKLLHYNSLLTKGGKIFNGPNLNVVFESYSPVETSTRLSKEKKMALFGQCLQNQLSWTPVRNCFWRQTLNCSYISFTFWDRMIFENLITSFWRFPLNRFFFKKIPKRNFKNCQLNKFDVYFKTKKTGFKPNRILYTSDSLRLCLDQGFVEYMKERIKMRC